MVTEPGEPRVGDLVLVPWGLDQVEGQIVEVYSTGLGPRATVRLLGGDDTVVLPLDSIAKKESSKRYPGPSRGLEYEAIVGAALRRAATELNLDGPRQATPDLGADFVLQRGNRRLLVKVKQYGEGIRVSTDTILTVAGLADKNTAALLVADAALASAAQHRLEQLARGPTRVWFVRWRGSNDDRDLRAAFSRLLLNWK